MSYLSFCPYASTGFKAALRSNDYLDLDPEETILRILEIY